MAGMNTVHLPDFEVCLAECGTAVNALELSSLHGLICGLICAKPELELSELVEVLEKIGIVDMLESSMSSQLGILLEVSKNQLLDDQCEFEIWLPDDETKLSARTSCLGEWCSAVLVGLSEFASEYLANIDGEAREAIGDFTAIARVAEEPIEGSEADEEDFMQISEYCRVALLLFREALIRGSLRGPETDERLH